MDSQPHAKNRPEILQMMTTEHYNLQSGRSLALSEANGRAGLFLGKVSSSLIALAFVGNITHVGTQLGTAFFVFALGIPLTPGQTESYVYGIKPDCGAR